MTQAAATRRPGARFLLAHPAHLIALGFGSGLSPVAPGTVGTLWAWAAFLLLSPMLSSAAWGAVIGVGIAVGVWACCIAARHLAAADPGAIVWDEVVAFWLVLWIVMPMSLAGQLAAFVLFRVFDTIKMGPVGWADRLVRSRPGEPAGWRHGIGILLDDLVAAGMTLLVMAVVARIVSAG